MGCHGDTHVLNLPGRTCDCGQMVYRSPDMAELDTQPAATELQALLGVPDATPGHGVQLPEN